MTRDGRAIDGLRARPVRAVALGLALCLAGCAAGAAARAERDAAALVAHRTRAELGEREAQARRPELIAAEPDAPVLPALVDGPRAAREQRVLSLADALAIAVQQNRGYVSEREALELAALALLGIRRDFGPLPSAALSYVFSGGSVLASTQSAGLAAQLSHILPFGGTATLSADAGAFDTSDDAALDPTTFSSGVTLTVLQPLLRGAGLALTEEPLVQAERSLVYAVRDFELFREDFSLDVASRYYDLVQQSRALENQRQNLESFTFGSQQAEALNRVGRVNSLDVLRARRSELNARNTLLALEENHELALDRFRIFLGLPDTVRVDVVPDEPEFVPVLYDLDSAVAVALENRLDLLNRREQLTDAERGLRLAGNALLPDLDLAATVNVAESDAPSFGDSSYDDDYSLSLTFGLPLDRVKERNALRSAEITLARERRALEQFQDELVVEIESAFRELTRRVNSLEIQRQLIEDQLANVRIAQIRFERGEVSNRDKVEAEQALLEAKNALIAEQVDYEIARLRLLRALGILFIDEHGMWRA